MGLQKDIKLESGVHLPEAYINVQSFTVVPKTSLGVSVQIYKDYTARLDNRSAVVTFRYTATGTEFHSNFTEDVLRSLQVCYITQIYNWLKTKNFWKDAISVYEEEEK